MKDASAPNVAVKHPTPLLSKPAKLSLLALVLASALIYYFSNPKPWFHFDYTFRIAGALLHGSLGLKEQPPSWLNEMVPFEGFYYSVFPFGSVLTMLPVALLKEAGVIKAFPTAVIVALTAGAICCLLFLLALRYDISQQRRWLLVSFMMFGTWMWCNLAFGGAWQLALGFAVLGQLGALYFILVKPRPLIAGLFFALAFGNRTEIILLAPLFMYLACRDAIRSPDEIIRQWPTLLKFSLFPFLLGVATLVYNYLRFDSPFDFGYARIPGILEQPFYRQGIFSIHSISHNMKAMLFEKWRVLDRYPYLVPTGFGGSIFLSSPFLVMMFRMGSRDFGLKVIAWIAIVLLTSVLWLHGGPGGRQFSYRYAMVLLPWIFLILLETRPRKASVIDTVLIAISIAVNAYATYLFMWTDYLGRR